MLRLERRADGFAILLGGRPLLLQSPRQPAFEVADGRARIEMRRGNFAIADRVTGRTVLRHVSESDDRLLLSADPTSPPVLSLGVKVSDTALWLTLQPLRPVARFWVTLMASPGEALWGGGAQMSYLDLSGRRFPVWTSEPGVGREPGAPITLAAGEAGGDYWTTNYPQPSFLSSAGYALHLDTTAYAELDFRDPSRHVLHAWAVPAAIEVHAGDRPGLVGALGARFGRAARLPDWTQHGLILGLKRGEAHAVARLAEAEAAGIPVAALWCEDWAGIRRTSFGTRLFWDWRWSRERYPTLDRLIDRLHARGQRFLGYANPYLCTDGALFAEAAAAGAFARDGAGGITTVDFGEFDCGVIDLTGEGAVWFRDRVLRSNMLDLGLDGWMADFGEYLPVDIRLATGDPMIEHNRWPVRWAAVNAAAIAAAGRTGDALFFMRAGGAGIQAHCPLLWAGDQCVDFSRHDGLGTAITAALSAGLLGNPCSHGDIGGYTSLFGLRRTPELLMRWAEFAAFGAVMRTHEGNRPDDNLQWWQDEAVTRHLGRMVRGFAALAPLRAALLDEAERDGLPLLRPPLLHFPGDPSLHALHDHALLGRDLLIAPVHQGGVTQWPVRLPAGARWRHLWSDSLHDGGQTVVIDAPIGQPPVFLREGAAVPGIEAAIAAFRA